MGAPPRKETEQPIARQFKQAAQRQRVRAGATTFLLLGIFFALFGGMFPAYLGGPFRFGINTGETLMLNAHNQLNQQFSPTLRPSQYGVTTQPVISDITGSPVAYFGGQDGNEYAINPTTGAILWQQYLSQVPNCGLNPYLGVSSTATVATVTIANQPRHVVFVGGADSTIPPSKKTYAVPYFYALDADNQGQVLWRTPLPSPWGAFNLNAYVWSSAALYPVGASDPSIYIGLASIGDCPLVTGELYKVDAATGAILAHFEVVPAGCLGGSVWGSPTIDPATSPATVYIGTGNPDPNNPPCGGSQNYSSSVVALNADDLTYLSSWQLPPAQLACPKNNVDTYDCDFGSTPTPFQQTINGTTHNMIGIANKDGSYYAFDRAQPLSNGPVWQYQIGTGVPPGAEDGSISPSAYDVNLNPRGDGSLGTLYMAGGAPPTGPGTACAGDTNSLGSLQALDLNVNVQTTTPPIDLSAAPAYRECAVCFDDSLHPGDGAVIGAVMAIANTNGTAPHAAIVGEGSWIVVVDGSSGVLNASYTPDPNLGNIYVSAPAVADGILYIGDNVPNGSGGYLEAFN
jgi:hypothetical protein